MVLHPRYAPAWQHMRGAKGFGATSVLRALAGYNNLLVTTQRDTFTQPFEVPTQQIGECD